MLCDSLTICFCWYGYFLAGGVDAMGHFLVFGSMLVQVVRQLYNCAPVKLLQVASSCLIADHFGITLRVARNCCQPCDSIQECSFSTDVWEPNTACYSSSDKDLCKGPTHFCCV